MDLNTLNNYGFLVYENTGTYVLAKVAVPRDSRELASQTFATYEDAVLAGSEGIYQARSSQKFTAIVRYDRGLGIEYKTLSEFPASDLVEAKAQAAIIAEKELPKKANIKEIRVRLCG